MFDDCLLFTIVLLRCIVCHTLHCWCWGVKFKDLSANILSLLRTINVVAIFVSLSSSASFSFFSTSSTSSSSSRSFRILILSLQSQAKFSPERAKECIDWIEEVKPPPPPPYFIFRNKFCSDRAGALHYHPKNCPILPDIQLLGKVDDVAQPLVEGDRVQAGDGGEGPGGLRHSPQGWSCSLPVSI